jgi:hypothetical protein
VTAAKPALDWLVLNAGTCEVLGEMLTCHKRIRWVVGKRLGMQWLRTAVEMIESNIKNINLNSVTCGGASQGPGRSFPDRRRRSIFAKA